MLLLLQMPLNSTTLLKPDTKRAMMFVPIENVVAANMPVEGLMSVYLSMGVSAAEYMKTTPVEANDTLPPKPENNDNE